MKYAVVALTMLACVVATLLLAPVAEQCCEYFGLIAPDGVSERPGIAHAHVEPPRPDGEIPDNVPGLKLHDAAGEVELPDLLGGRHKIDFAAHKFTVVVFLSSLCPTSQIYEARLNELHARFGADVAFWGVNADAMEGLPELRAHFVESDKPDRIKFTMLKDYKAVICRRWSARVCPDVFVFNREGKLEYRGGVDDNRVPTRVTVSYLGPALADLLAGKRPLWRYQKSTGCCPIDADPEETLPAGSR